MAVAGDSLRQPGEGNNPGWLARLVGANSKYQTRRALWGYAFALPWLVGLVVFWGGPILASFYIGFTEYGVTDSPTFVGLDNYVRAFTVDDLFWPSLGSCWRHWAAEQYCRAF